MAWAFIPIRDIDLLFQLVRNFPNNVQNPFQYVFPIDTEL